jgi:hypothetical protein
MATGSSTALTIANYAYSTANHDQPPHLVTAEDVSNAAATPIVNKQSLIIGMNIGDDLTYPRLVLFVNEASYKQTCVYFPTTLGQIPTVLSCPAKAIVLWDELSEVLNRSRDAVASAASNGRAVSAADVSKFFVSGNIKLLKLPIFRSGRGGVVTFVAKLNVNGKVTNSNFCVRFPKTVAGIPVQVSCN